MLGKKKQMKRQWEEKLTLYTRRNCRRKLIKPRVSELTSSTLLRPLRIKSFGDGFVKYLRNSGDGRKKSDDFELYFSTLRPRASYRLIFFFPSSQFPSIFRIKIALFAAVRLKKFFFFILQTLFVRAGEKYRKIVEFFERHWHSNYRFSWKIVKKITFMWNFLPFRDSFRIIFGQRIQTRFWVKFYCQFGESTNRKD